MKNILIQLLSLWYSNLSTLIENFFLKKKNSSSELIKIGFYKDKLKLKNNYNDFVEKKIPVNSFFEKLIINEKYIDQIINNILNENDIKEKLFEITGFNYSIDFFSAYSTYSIDIVNLQKDIYANHWHKDKPFSKNTLKIIIPIDKISNNDGPMEIISIKDSNRFNIFSNIKSMDFENKCTLTGTEEDVYFFLPNLCYHRAGIPFLDQKRTQIMFQLNPANKWRYSTSLYKKQYLMEPKFPLFNFKDKYKLI